MKSKKVSTGLCLRNARMLVPKFAIHYETKWYIHWPKDQPLVLEAKTKPELVIKLATFMNKIERVGNQGKHVKPETSIDHIRREL